MAAQPDDWMAVRRQNWRDGTAFMSPAARGVYMDICLEYFALGPLPNDDEVLRGLGRCTEKIWRQVKAQVLGKFNEQDGILFHERVDKERAEAHQRFATKSAAGRIAGQASAEAKRQRAAKQPSTNRSTTVEPDVQRQSNVRATPLTEYISPDGDKHPSDVLAKRPKRKSQIPPDWEPTAKDIAHAADRQLDQNTIRAIVGPFRDHHLAKQTLSADFSANWRTWVANHIGFHGTGPWPRPDAGRPRPNAGPRQSAVAARDAILAKAGLSGRGDHPLHPDNPGGAECDADRERDFGPVIDADEWQRVPGSADGTEGDDETNPGLDGRRGSAVHGVSETADGLPRGRGAVCADDTGGIESLVAGLGRAEGAIAYPYLPPADDAGSLEIPAFLKRTVAA